MARLRSLASVIGVAALLLGTNGGIGVGFSNHVGLLPVVRRLMDPDYLPGDFGIQLRLYHHRVFAHIVAALARTLGEDGALIVLSVAGMVLLAWALWFLCRAVGLSDVAFWIVGLAVAVGAGWTGRGLEVGTLVGNPYIQPTTYAHAFVLMAVGKLVKDRFAAAAFLVGLACLVHVQIGATFALILLLAFGTRWVARGLGESARCAGLFLLAASPALWHLGQMVRGGLLASAWSFEYIEFRIPHNYALASAAAVAWVGVHLAVQGGVHRWLRRTGRPEARPVGLLFRMSLWLAILSAAHVVDYMLVRHGAAAKMTFIRMSLLITVFGIICLVVGAEVWGATRGGEARGRWALAGARISLLAGSLVWGMYAYSAEVLSPSLEVRRYREQRSAWVDMCRWIREQGPRDAVYLTPPGREGFAYLSDRSPVVEFKINPDGGMHLEEWLTRLRDVAGGTLPAGRGFKNSGLLNAAFEGLGPGQLAALGQKYKAKYVVLPSGSSVEMPVLYRNAGYRLVRLPARPGP